MLESIDMISTDDFLWHCMCYDDIFHAKLFQQLAVKAAICRSITNSRHEQRYNLTYQEL